MMDRSSLLSSNEQQKSSTPNFSVKSYTGNTFIMPSSIPLSNTSKGLVGSVIGGNWSFSVKGGTLQDFKWNAVAYTLSGKVNGTLSINGLSGATVTGVVKAINEIVMANGFMS
jgi:hypothetical protein